MSTYFELIPDDMIIEIGLYLDYNTLFQFKKKFKLRVLDSKRFWYAKYDLEFPDVTWRAIIKDEDLMVHYKDFVREYNDAKNLLNGLTHDGLVVEHNIFIINYRDNQILNYLSLYGKTRFIQNHEDDVSNIKQLILYDKRNGSSEGGLNLTYKLPEKKYYFDLYFNSGSYSFPVTYREILDVILNFRYNFKSK